MKKRNVFKWSYLGFAAVLLILAVAAILYVRGLLVDYEAARPERQAEAAMATLSAEAKQADFWKKYQLPSVDKGIQKDYLALYEGELNYVSLPGTYAEDEMGYLIRNGSFPLAEVLLKAGGPAETKLAVFTIQEWRIQEIRPVLEKREYTVSVPKDFKVWAEGVLLTDGLDTEDGRTKYTVGGVYLEPQFKITDASGKQTTYTVKNFRVLPDIFDYTLKLPSTLSVTVDGKKMEGVALTGGRVRYDILRMDKPEVLITDLYGNTFTYEGQSDLPLTYATVLAPADYKVTIDGKAIPASAMKKGVAAEFAILEGLVEDLPVQIEYRIAMLKADAKLAVYGPSGNALPLEAGQAEYSFVPVLTSTDTVPEKIAAQVDVLKVAQNWSLFMSNDVSFSKMAKEMLPDSNQYEVARKYANSVDKQFFASHSLLSPAFTDNKVSNFTQITEDCFSVEVRFVKHMRLTNGGKLVDDAMNDRFYFVRSGNEWLLAGMKEVGDHV